jgi:hypothetical protein
MCIYAFVMRFATRSKSKQEPWGFPRALACIRLRQKKIILFDEIFILQITNLVRLNIFSVHLKLFALKRHRLTDGHS